jgi:hypothetical protein
MQVSKFLEEFDIEEKPFSYLAEQYPHLTIANKVVERLDTEKQVRRIEMDRRCGTNPLSTLDHLLFGSNANSIRFPLHLYRRSTESKLGVNILSTYVYNSRWFLAAGGVEPVRSRHP